MEPFSFHSPEVIECTPAKSSKWSKGLKLSWLLANIKLQRAASTFRAQGTLLYSFRF